MRLSLEPDRALARIRRLGWGLGAGCAALGLLWGAGTALAVLAGAGLAMTNYAAVEAVTVGLTRRAPRRAAWAALAWVVLRYALLVGALYVIFARWRASVVAVAVGLSAPVAAIFVELGLELAVLGRRRRGAAEPAVPSEKA